MKASPCNLFRVKKGRKKTSICRGIQQFEGGDFEEKKPDKVQTALVLQLSSLSWKSETKCCR
jgi:hypothetical protein